MKTDNLRKYQLSFCVVCKNKEHSFKEGAICSLTKQKADFQEKCINYILDKELLSEQKKKIKEKIYGMYPEENTINKLISNRYYKSSSEINPQEIDEYKSTTFYNPVNSKSLFFVMLIYSIYYIITKFDLLIDLANNKSEIYNFSLIIIFLGITYYTGFVKKYVKDKIRIDDIGFTYRESEFGSKYKTLRWNEILEFGILTAPSKHLNSYYIIFGTKYLEVLDVDITSMEFTPEQYIGIINDRLKNVAQHRV